MKITLELKGQALLNFTAAMDAVEADQNSPHWRRALATHFITVAADAVARAGWFNLPPIGLSMELRAWSANEWAAYRILNPAPLASGKEVAP